MMPPMPFELKATRKIFELVDGSGYRFQIIAEQVEEGDRKGSWKATLIMEAAGFISDESAVCHLRGPAEQFLRMLGEARD